MRGCITQIEISIQFRKYNTYDGIKKRPVGVLRNLIEIETKQTYSRTCK